MNTRIISIFSVFLIFAVILGVLAITDSSLSLSIVLILLVIVLILILGKKIWLLIPFTMFFSGTIPIVPGNFSVKLLGIMLATGVTGVLIFLRKSNIQIKITVYHIIIFLFLLILSQTYLRNPTGLNILGSQEGGIGGRSYVEVFICLFGFLLLSFIHADRKDFLLMPKLMLSGYFVDAITSFIASFVPHVGKACVFVYSSFAPKIDDGLIDIPEEEGAANRNKWAVYLSDLLQYYFAINKTLLSWIKFPDCKFRNFILGSLLSIITLLMSFLTGFRNISARVLVAFLIMVFLYFGIKYALRICVFVAILFLFVNIVNVIYPLHPNIQRAISYLPSTAEQRYVKDGEGSSEWRFEMWEEAILTDVWIKNKVWGDGLRFEKNDFLAQQKQGKYAARSGWDPNRESLMSRGDFHSGPISSIRVIGYVGTSLFYIFYIFVAYRAYKIFRIYKNTSFEPLAMLVAIYAIVSVIVDIFIYGYFHGSSQQFIMITGLVCMLDNNKKILFLEKSNV